MKHALFLVIAASILTSPARSCEVPGFLSGQWELSHHFSGNTGILVWHDESERQQLTVETGRITVSGPALPVPVVLSTTCVEVVGDQYEIHVTVTPEYPDGSVWPFGECNPVAVLYDEQPLVLEDVVLCPEPPCLRVSLYPCACDAGIYFYTRPAGPAPTDGASWGRLKALYR